MTDEPLISYALGLLITADARPALEAIGREFVATGFLV